MADKRKLLSKEHSSVAGALIMLQLKLMQRLGYSAPLAGIPLAIATHVCRKLRITRPTKDALARYDDGGGQKSFDLSAYIGQTVTIRFLGIEDGSLATSFLVDDVSVNVQ